MSMDENIPYIGGTAGREGMEIERAVVEGEGDVASFMGVIER